MPGRQECARFDKTDVQDTVAGNTIVVDAQSVETYRSWHAIDLKLADERWEESMPVKRPVLKFWTMPVSVVY